MQEQFSTDADPPTDGGFFVAAKQERTMDVLGWIGLVLLAFAAGLVGGAVAANVTVRQTVAADQERLQRMGGALVAARRDVVEAGEILRSVKAGRQ